MQEDNDKLNIESSSSKEEQISSKSQLIKYSVESANDISDTSLKCEENYRSHPNILINQKYNNTYGGNNRSLVNNKQLYDHPSTSMVQKFKLPKESFGQVINVDNREASTFKINGPFSKQKESF